MQARLAEPNNFGRLRIRTSFVHRPTPPPGWQVTSDRNAPPRELRPSATRIMSSGPALRFYLAALVDAQIRYRHGARPDNPRPIRTEKPGATSWIDSVASASVTTGPTTAQRMTARTKKERHLQGALRRLETAGLVELPKMNSKIQYDGFTLLNEWGARDDADPELLDYRVPIAAEPCVELPATFISNGWIHVLEDSEIAVLLMVACGLHNLPNEPMVAIPGDDRLAHYGLSRTAYMANRMLAWLGLLQVVPVDRWMDGTRAEGYETPEDARLHRMAVMEEGFNENPVETLTAQLKHQLSR